MIDWMKVAEDSWKNVPKEVFCSGGTKTLAELSGIAYGNKKQRLSGDSLTDEELKVVESMRNRNDGNVPVLPFS